MIFLVVHQLGVVPGIYWQTWNLKLSKETFQKGLFWEVIKANTDVEVKDAFEKIQEINSLVFNYLKQISQALWWSYAYDINIKANHVTNKMSKSWNASLGLLRGGLVFDLFEGIWKKIIVLITAKT